MNIRSTDPQDAFSDRSGANERPPARVLVLFDATANGAAALREAAACCGGDTHLTVVTLAPQSVQPRCCSRGATVEPLNCAIREAAEGELAEARKILGDTSRGATFKSLVGMRDPPLAEWAAQQTFDVIVLPARRLSFGGHPFARRLRRATVAELRLVG